MGFILKARCPACSYENKSISIGNYNLIANCTACKSLANPNAVPFRYELPPCDGCGASLNKKDFVSSSSIRCGYEWTPSELTCPRCEKNVLEFAEVLHFSMMIVDRCPELGAEIHGCYERPRYYPSMVRTREEVESGEPEFNVPGMWIRDGNIEVLDVPAREVDRRMVLRVVGLERDGESVKKLTLRFERWLT